MEGIITFQNNAPQIAEDVLIAAGAKVIGQVTLGQGSSVWYNSVLRGDMNTITVGEYTNIQDGSIVHNAPDQPCKIGSYVVVGHRCVLHGCTVSDYCIIGMGAVLMDGSEIGEGSIVGAGALVTQGTVIPPYSLVLGAPAKVIKSLDPQSVAERKEHALRYYQFSQEHRKIR